MPSQARFKMDTASMGRFLRSRVLQAGMMQAAHDALPSLKAALPVGKEKHPRAPHMRDQVRAEAALVPLKTRQGGVTIRAGARLVIDSDHAVFAAPKPTRKWIGR